MKILISTLLAFVIMLLAACSGYNGNDSEENGNQDRVESGQTRPNTEEATVPIPDEIIEEILNLEPMLHLESKRVNQVSLLDVTTNQTVATHEFDEYEAVDQLWNLGDGYFAAFVGEEHLWLRAQRLYNEAGNIGTIDVPWDERSQTERNFRIIIFDEQLNMIDEMPFDEEGNMPLFGSIMIFENGELFIYGTYLDTNCFVNTICRFQRLHVKTGEVEILFESDQSLTSHGLIADDQLLITLSSGGGGGPGQGGAPSFAIQYGILDLNTGEKELFEQTDFWISEVIYNESFMIISGNNTANGHDHLSRTGEIIIFDIANKTSITIQKDDNEFTMLFSYDNQHLITLTSADAILSKYDMNGTIIAQKETDLPNGINVFKSQIFPITTDIFAIHLYFWDNQVGSTWDDSDQVTESDNIANERQVLFLAFD